MLGRLVRLDPVSEGINFAYGLSWLSLGDPAPAGAAFDRILQINPKNDRARVELARARIMAKRFPEAKKELRKVLTASLPPAVRQSIQAYLDEAGRGISRWYYSGDVTVAGLHDSNANIGPDSDIIAISPINMFGTTIRELNVSEKSQPVDTFGLSLAASARAMCDLGEPKGWMMVTDADLYRNILKENDYEVMSLQAGIGPKLMFNRGFIQVPFRARYLEYGGDALAWLYGLYPFFAYAPADLKGLSFITSLTAELRDFDVLTARDGCYFSVSEIARKSFAGGKYGIYGGAELIHDHTDSAVYEYNGFGVIAGADARLPWKVSAFGEARYYCRNYKDKDPLAPRDREDDQFMIALGLSKDISDRFTVTLTENMIDNNSSFELYEYKRYITTLSTSWRF
ncbi:MAG: porin family protein [Kiritimatiellae bacterium]|nr:porin family protein [Kiritimatiellia bacterium]